jgi:hypothetical protein
MGNNVKKPPILEHQNPIPRFDGVFSPERRRDHDLAFVEHLYRFHSTPQIGIKLNSFAIMHNLFWV